MKEYFVIPETCPVCGFTTRIDISESGTETLVCTNDNCSAKNLSKYVRFVSKHAMDIEGLSEATLYSFMEKGWINNYVDIYSLPLHEDEIVNMDGFGKKSMSNLVSALEKSKKVNSDKFLFSLNIPQCGKEVAKILMNKFTLDEFITMMLNNDSLVLNSLEGFGTEKSLAIHTWINKNVDVINELRGIITVNDIKKEKAISGSCSGLTFVITGDVHNFKNREELKQFSESRGGKTTGSVSAKTSYLINNDINSISGKNNKAKELGVEIISEDEFMSRFV